MAPETACHRHLGPVAGVQTTLKRIKEGWQSGGVVGRNEVKSFRKETGVLGQKLSNQPEPPLVEHDGNIQQSQEEVERVKAMYDELCGRLYTAKDGTTRPLALEDFLFIAPYNAQVRALQAALPQGARVGSVDKFQGQEAPVCILSLCSSYGEYGSRGLAFILDRNRVNVAISRAQCLAVVVADPRIAGSTPGSLDEMMLLNLLCKLADSTRRHGGARLDKSEAS